MSACSAAFGVLSLIAAVHIVLSIVLGALIAVVCYYGKLSKREGRLLAKREDHIARERSRALLEVEGPDKLDLSGSKTAPPESESPSIFEGTECNTQETEVGLYNNSWTGTTEIEEVRRVSFEKPPVQPSANTEEVVLRKKSRMSVASIASNLSNRFRKSLDLDSTRDRDDALRLMRERSSSERESSASERDNTDDGLEMTVTVGEGEGDTTDDVIKVNLSAVEINGNAGESEC